MYVARPAPVVTYGQSEDLVCTADAPQQVILTPNPAVVRINHNITLKCAADALPKPGYLWIFDGKILNKAVKNTLTIQNAEVKDAGSYTCKAENFYGSKETTRVVNVECECINDHYVINYGILAYSAQPQIRLLFYHQSAYKNNDGMCYI